MDRHGRRLLALSALAFGSTAAGYPNLAHAWVGQPAAGTYVIFLLVAGAFFISNTTGVLTVVLRAEGALAPEMWGAIVAAISNVPITLWFGTKFGLVGVVLASAVATLLGNATYLSLVRDAARDHAFDQVKAGFVASVALSPALLLGALAPVYEGRAASLGAGAALTVLGMVLTLAALTIGRLVGPRDVAYVRRMLRSGDG